MVNNERNTDFEGLWLQLWVKQQMLGNGAEMSLNNRQILGPLNFGWAPNHLVLGAKLAPGEIKLVCFPVHVSNLLQNGHFSIFSLFWRPFLLP